MRNLLFTIFIVAGAISFTGCKKEKKDPPLSIFGSWELRKSFGGHTGSTYTVSPGNGYIYKFFADSSFQYYNNGPLLHSGSFTMLPGSYYGGWYEYILVLKEARGDTRYYMHLENTRFIIDDGISVADGYTYFYDRIE
jgi:hypothetical protein